MYAFQGIFSCYACSEKVEENKVSLKLEITVLQRQLTPLRRSELRTVTAAERSSNLKSGIFTEFRDLGAISKVMCAEASLK